MKNSKVLKHLNPNTVEKKEVSEHLLNVIYSIMTQNVGFVVGVNGYIQEGIAIFFH